MSQKTSEFDTCHIATCRKPWLTHHAFNSFTKEGLPSFHCHTEPVATPDLVVAYIIGLRSDKLKKQEDIKALKKQHVLDTQASRADLERSFGAKVTHLENVLKEVRGDNQSLRDVKMSLADLLDARERWAVDLQLETDELKAGLQEERRQHEDLKRDSKEVFQMAFAIGHHVETLGGKLEGLSFKYVFLKEADQRPPIEVEDLTRKVTPTPAPAAPAPIPTPAPKAVVVTAHVAAPQAAPAPIPPTNTVVLDAPTPESSASADDEDIDDGVSYDCLDDAAIDEMRTDSAEGDDASSEDEEALTEDDEPEECRACNEAATHGFTFTKKDGETERMTTCGQQAHAGDFLNHLMKVAKADPESALKRMPKNAEALERLFKANPINPNPQR